MSLNFLMKIILIFFLLQIVWVEICTGNTTKNEHEDSSGFDPLLVTIPSGKLRGKVLRDKNGEEFYAFQTIPYAKKPIGELRFKQLQKLDKWNGTLDATKVPPNCLSDEGGPGSEDCIYLNVFTHRKKELHPVMFYIFGGALVSGSVNPETMIGPEFLLTKDIVLVTINYRLGILGFLNYEYPENEGIDPNSPDNQKIADEISSNNGFKDQVFALKWVQENIKYFAGDKNKVTIFGHSAGALCVHALALSPLTSNLFNQVILQSSVAVVKGIAVNNSAVYVGNILGLDTKNITNLMEGLRNLTEKEILDLQTKIDIYKVSLDTRSIAALLIEKPGPNSFMSENPWTLIQSGNYKHRPIMMGILNSEGIIFEYYKYIDKSTHYYNISSFIPYYYNFRDAAALKMDEDFFPTQNYSDLDTWINFWGYAAFVFDIIRCASELRNWSDVYFYEFDWDTELNWSKRRDPHTAKLKGAAHGDELGYLFKTDISPKIETGSANDIAIDKMVTIWTNFATYGMPIPPESVNNSLFNGQKWQPLEKDTFNLMKIDQIMSTGILNLTEFYYWQNLHDTFSSGVL